MKQATWDALDQLFRRTPVLAAGGVPVAEVRAAERRVGHELPRDFRQFVERYGGAVVGSLPVLGLRRAEVMGSDYSFVEVTESFRRDGWIPGNGWVVISIDLAGNPIGLNPAGEVLVSDHDAGATSLLSPSFEGFVEMLLAQ
jgi:hypothetical protein